MKRREPVHSDYGGEKGVSMDESKKELFKRVYSRQPLTMKFVMVLLAGFAVLVFSGVEQAIEWSDVTVWVFVFVLLATHIAYAVRFGRLIPCHEDFRSPFRLLLTGTVLWAVGALVLYGCIHWDFRGELLYVFFVVVAVDIIAVHKHWVALESFSRGLSEELGDAWVEHRRKMRRLVATWFFVGIGAYAILSAVFFFVLAGFLSDASGLAVLGAFVEMFYFAVFFGGVLAVILLIFCAKVNRADKEMVDRTIAEMNRGEMEECKLLNP